MTIRPADFCSIAEQLYRGDRLAIDETCLRTAAGRAYYAAFLEVREAVRRKYMQPGFDVHHRTLGNELKKVGGDVGDVGLRLLALFEKRVDADYFPGRTLSKLEVGLAIKSAQAIIAKVPSITANIPAGIPEKF